MKLIYVRHGEVAYPNGPLSERGRVQAEGTIDYIALENPVKIYCSPQLRAKQTAEIIAKGLNLEIEVLPELDERVRVEKDEELVVESNYFNYDYENSKIQTCRDFIEKNFKGFYKILENHKEKNESVVIVAHSSTSYALTTFVNGVPSDRKIGWTQCSNCAVIKFFVEN